MADAYTVLFLLAIATFVFAILGVNIFGASMAVDNLRSAFAVNLMRPGMRVFVSAPHKLLDHGQVPGTARERLPAFIANISIQTNPVRPLRVQPVYGYTYASTPTDMQPFWSAVPTVSLSRSSDPSEVLSPDAIKISAVIPRFNADTFWDGLLMAIQMSLGVDVSESLGLAVASLREDWWMSYVYVVLVILLGNWILFNCFIATMIVSFRREAIVSQGRQAQIRSGEIRKEEARTDASRQQLKTEMMSHAKYTSRIERMAVDGRSAQEVMATIRNLSTYKRQERCQSGELLARALMSKQSRYEDEIEAVLRTEQWARGVKNQILQERCRILRQHLTSTLRLLDDGIMILTSPDTLGMFDPLDPARVRALAFIRSQTFQYMINFLLLCSTACLAMERRGIGLDERNILDVANLVLNIVFLFEFLLKAFALSLEAYIKDPLNRIDLFIVICGVVDVTLTLLDPPLIKTELVPSSNTEIFGVLRILRIVKTMRPLRILLFRIERVRIVVNAMRDSIGPLQLAASIGIILVRLPCSVSACPAPRSAQAPQRCCNSLQHASRPSRTPWSSSELTKAFPHPYPPRQVLVLAVFAQQLIAGRMSSCSDPFISSREACTGEGDDGRQRVWRPADLNCDWVGDSTVLIFTAISKDRWREILWSLADITTRDTGHNPLS